MVSTGQDNFSSKQNFGIELAFCDFQDITLTTVL